MPDEFKSAVDFGRKRDDFYRIAARLVIFVEKFRAGLSDVFERLRAHMLGRDERAFEMNAENFRALILALFSDFLTALSALVIFSGLCVIVVAKNPVVPSLATNSEMVCNASTVPSIASAPPAP